MTVLLVVAALWVLAVAAFGIAEWRDPSNRHTPGDVLPTLLSAAIGLVRIAFRILVFLIGLAIPAVTGMLDGPRMPDSRGQFSMPQGMRVCLSCRGRGAHRCSACRGKGCPCCAGGGSELCTRCGGMGAVNA